MHPGHKTCPWQLPVNKTKQSNLFKIHSAKKLQFILVCKCGTCLNEHFDSEDDGEHVVGRCQEHSLGAAWRDVWSFHGECYAVEGYKEQHDIVEPLLVHEPRADLPEPVHQQHKAVDSKLG